MNTITEHILDYLSTPKGQRDREYNNTLKYYLKLLNEGEIGNNDINSHLGGKIQEFIKIITSSPNSDRSKELLENLKQELDIYLQEHFVLLQGLKNEEDALKQFEALKKFLETEKELSISQEYTNKIDSILGRINSLIIFIKTELFEPRKPSLDSFFEKMQLIYSEAITRDRTDVANELIINQLEEFRAIKTTYLDEKSNLLDRFATERCEVKNDAMCDINSLISDDSSSLGLIGMYPYTLVTENPRLLKRRDQIFELGTLSHTEVLEKYSDFEIPKFTFDELTPAGDFTDTINKLFEDGFFVDQLVKKDGYEGLTQHQLKEKFIKDFLLSSEESIRSVSQSLKSQLGNGEVELKYGDGGKSIIYNSEEEKDRAVVGYMLLFDGILNDPNSKFDAIGSWLASIITGGIDIYTIIGTIIDPDNHLLDGLLLGASTGSLIYYLKNVPINIPLTNLGTLRSGFNSVEGQSQREVKNYFWRTINRLDSNELIPGSNEYNRIVNELGSSINGDFNLSERLEIFNYYIKHASSKEEIRNIQEIRRKFLLLKNDNYFYTTLHRQLVNNNVQRIGWAAANKTILGVFNARTYQKGGQINFGKLNKEYIENFKDYFLDKVRYDNVETLSKSPLISDSLRKTFKEKVNEIVKDPNNTLDGNAINQMQSNLDTIDKATSSSGYLSSFRSVFETEVDILFTRFNNGELPLTGDGENDSGLNNKIFRLLKEKEDLLKIYSPKFEGKLSPEIRKLEAEFGGIENRIRNIAITGLRNHTDGGEIITKLLNAVHSYSSPRTSMRGTKFIELLGGIEKEAGIGSGSVNEPPIIKPVVDKSSQGISPEILSDSPFIDESGNWTNDRARLTFEMTFARWASEGVEFTQEQMDEVLEKAKSIGSVEDLRSELEKISGDILPDTHISADNFDTIRKNLIEADARDMILRSLAHKKSKVTEIEITIRDDGTVNYKYKSKGRNPIGKATWADGEYTGKSMDYLRESVADLPSEVSVPKGFSPEIRTTLESLSKARSTRLAILKYLRKVK